jgi:hypothetical protein
VLDCFKGLDNRRLILLGKLRREILEVEVYDYEKLNKLHLFQRFDVLHSRLVVKHSYQQFMVRLISSRESAQNGKHLVEGKLILLI